MASGDVYGYPFQETATIAAASEGTMTRTAERVRSASWLTDRANETRSVGAAAGGGDLSMANWTDYTTRGVGWGVDREEAARPPNWPVLFLFGVVLLTIAGNALVCAAVWNNRKLQNMFNFFLVSLALSDTLSAILVMPLSIIRTFMEHLTVPKLLCVTWYSLDVLFTSSTICHLCMTSIDRYVSLRSPLRHRSQTQNKRSTALKISVVWAISLCIAGPLFILSMLHQQPTMTTTVTKHGDGGDDDEVIRYKGCGPETQAFVLSATVASFYVPLVIMTVMYALTVRALKRQLHEQRCLTVNNYSSSLMSNNSSFKEDNDHPEGRFPSSPTSDGPPTTLLPQSWPLLHLDHTVAPSAGDQLQHFERRLVVPPSRTTDASAPVSCPSSASSPRFNRRRRCCSPTFNLIRCGPCSTRGDSNHRTSSDSPHLLTGGDLLSPTIPPSSSSVSLNRLQRAASNRGRRHGLEVPVHSVCLSSSQRRGRRGPLRGATGLERGRRAVLVLGILFAVFIVFYLPFFGVYVVNATCTRCRSYISDRILTAFEWLQYSGSMVNPFVYHAFNPDFQRAFHKLLRCRSP